MIDLSLSQALEFEFKNTKGEIKKYSNTITAEFIAKLTDKQDSISKGLSKKIVFKKNIKNMENDNPLDSIDLSKTLENGIADYESEIIDFAVKLFLSDRLDEFKEDCGSDVLFKDVSKILYNTINDEIKELSKSIVGDSEEKN